MAQVTRKSAIGKPTKKLRPRQTKRPELLPHPDFPLFPHGSGRWAKKVRGTLHYFGKWDDPQGALEKWLEQKDDLLAGRTPRVSSEGLTIHELVNRFLTSKRHLVDTGELAARSFADYLATSQRIADVFGTRRVVLDLSTVDFEHLRKELARTRGPVALGNEIQRVRVVFKYAYDAALIDRPVRYGPTFKRPSKKVLRHERHRRGPRMFEAAELRTIIAAASIPLKAMIFLGINCGFGNADVGTLPIGAVKLKTGWIDYPRPKTAVPRRCPMWPETLAAVQSALDERPTPKDLEAQGLLFVTKYGKSWAKSPRLSDDASLENGLATAVDNTLAKTFGKFLMSLGLHRPGLGFYALRHTFETIAGDTKDQVAVDAVMGHADASMAAVYRERISDERLQAVVNHVRDWLRTNGRGPREKEPEGGWGIE